MWSALACLPPASRQSGIVSRHTFAASAQRRIHSSISLVRCRAVVVVAVCPVDPVCIVSSIKVATLVAERIIKLHGSYHAVKALWWGW